MKIALASSDGANVDFHLGKANSLYVYNFDEENLDFLERREVDIIETEKHQGEIVLEACEDCDVIISVQYGFKTKMNADDLEIKLVIDQGPIDEVLKRYIDHYTFMKK